jgi:hypothetical protein
MDSMWAEARCCHVAVTQLQHARVLSPLLEHFGHGVSFLLLQLALQEHCKASSSCSAFNWVFYGHAEQP